MIKSSPLQSAGRHSALLLTCAIFAVPAYLVLVNSFKDSAAATSDPFRFPLTDATLDNYAAAIADPSLNIWTAYLTSAVITASVVSLVLLIGSMLAFVVGLSRSRWSVWIQYSLLVGLIVPPQVLIIPVVTILKNLGLMNTLPGLIIFLVASSLPLAVFVLIGFVRGIPGELREAAVIDGAREFRMFFSIYLPLLVAPLASIGVILAVFTWNDFLSPLIILGPLGPPTITTGIYRSIGLYATDWAGVFTFAVLASIPMLILFFTFQRLIVSGLTAGALKG